jgi:hypothetical protein
METWCRINFYLKLNKNAVLTLIWAWGKSIQGILSGHQCFQWLGYFLIHITVIIGTFKNKKPQINSTRYL